MKITVGGILIIGGIIMGGLFPRWFPDYYNLLIALGAISIFVGIACLEKEMVK